MNTNQGNLTGNFIEEKMVPDTENTQIAKYYIVIVSPNDILFQALVKTLQNFSLNGKGIQVIRTKNLVEAQALARTFPEMVLVLIDDVVQVNGSYKVFVDFMENELNNKNCKILFMDEIIRNNPDLDVEKNFEQSDIEAGFLYARERLIDITRMVLLTTDMETKISGGNPHSFEDNINAEQKAIEPAPITRDKLYNVMAHDLKEPVGNIKVMLDFLTNEPDLLDQQTSKDLLQRVRESANSVHELLEDFLFWSRMFRQEIYFNPACISLEAVIRENTVLLKSVAAAKNITLSVQVENHACAFADEYMITTVIRNLIYNAIKFTDDGGQIDICAKIEEEMIGVEVKDNGIGISEENLKNLFQTDIYLSTNGTAHEKGSGLGLILCKDFIEKNGGRLIVNSLAGEGSTFSFKLPAWKFTNLT